MTSELLPRLAVPQLASHGYTHPRNFALSRSNPSLYPYRHCTGRLYTRCRSGLLDRRVRYDALLLVLQAFSLLSPTCLAMAMKNVTD